MTDTMDRKKKIIVSIIATILLILTLLGITYAYFLTRIKGNTNDKSIKIKTANLKLIYGDGNGTIKPDKLIIPGDLIDSKTFTVTNKGDETIGAYGVYLENVINEFDRTNDIKMKLICVEVNDETNEKIRDCDGFDDNVFPLTNSQIITNSIAPGLRHNYTLTITYDDILDTNQSIDMNKKLETKIQIYDTTNVYDLIGTITGSNENDYVELVNTATNEIKTSSIKNNSYKFVGLEPNNYEIRLKNKTNDTITTKGTKDFIINKSQTSSIIDNTINVDDTIKTINMNLTLNNTELNLDITTS